MAYVMLEMIVFHPKVKLLTLSMKSTVVDA